MQYLDNNLLTLASFCLIKLKDKIYAFTDAPEDVHLNGELYKSSNCFSRSAVANNYLTNVDNFEIYGAITSEDISVQELESAKLIGSEVEIFIADYTLYDNQKYGHKTGLVDTILCQDGVYIMQIRSVLDKLNQEIGETYSPKCRACFGDKQCGIAMDEFTYNADIIKTTDFSTLVMRYDCDISTNLKDGMLITGDNEMFRIVEHVGNTLYILNPYNRKFEAGLSCKVRLGCDKNFTTCITKFNNAINFRGEPHIPNVSQNLNW